MFNHDLFRPLDGPRARVYLFTEKNGAFINLPIEVNPTDSKGHLRFYTGDSWRSEPLEKSDLFIFSADHEWGRRFVASRDRLPCRGPIVAEFRAANQRSGYAYLTNCFTAYGHSAFVPEVVFEPDSNRLQSDAFVYEFSPENYMQFEQISLKRLGQMPNDIAEDSRLYIHANIRNFFTMTFDSDDIESKLKAYRTGSISNLAQLSFYLRVLFFRINMNLSTDVGFFAKSAHIPMMIHLPIDSTAYLNAGSGILYSWRLAPGATSDAVFMPMFEIQKIKQGWSSLATLSKNFCVNGKCFFRHVLRLNEQKLSMELQFDENIVARGFFPLFVSDVNSFKDEMGWKLDFADKERRVGFYFETSGLKSGEYPWEFWLRLVNEDSRPFECPSNPAIVNYL